jgi:hypothetical protein
MPGALHLVGSAQMASSCEERYLLCRKGSRMCEEADSSAELYSMDRLRHKTLFIGCAERVCAPNAPTARPLGAAARLPAGRTSSSATATARPAQNSAACARALLGLYLHVSEAAGTSGRERVAAAAENGHRRRQTAAAIASLRERAARGAPTIDAVCAVAWARADGTRRMPIFVDNATSEARGR